MMKALVSCLIMGGALIVGMCIGEPVLELVADLFPSIGQRIGLVPEDEDPDDAEV